MSRGYRELALSIGSKSASIVSTMGVQLFLAWFLQADGRGSYAVCVLFSNLLAITFLMGIELAGVFHISSRRLNFSEGVLTTALCVGAGSLLAVSTGLTLMQFPLTFFDKADRPELYLSLVSIPLFMYSLVFIELFTSIRQFGLYSFMSLFRCVSLFIITSIYLGLFRAGVPGAILAIITTDILTVAVCLVVFRKKCGLSWMPLRIIHLKGMLSYGFRYWIGVISNQLNFRIGTLVIAFFASRTEIGIYALALSITMQMLILPDALRAVLVPRTSGNCQETKELVAKCARLVALASFLMLAGFLVLSKPFVVLFLPASFAPAIPLMKILALSFFVRTLGKSVEPYLIGCNRPGIISFSVAVGMLTNVLALFVLIPQYRVAGAAWSVALNYFVSSAVLLIGFSRLAEVGLLSTWRIRSSDFGFLWTLRSQLFPARKTAEG